MGHRAMGPYIKGPITMGPKESVFLGDEERLECSKYAVHVYLLPRFSYIYIYYIIYIHTVYMYHSNIYIYIVHIYIYIHMTIYDILVDAQTHHK